MSRRVHDDRSVRLLSLALLTVVFLAGALTGAVLLDSGFAMPAADADEPSSPTMAALELTDDQRTEIDRILAATQPQADSIIRSSIEGLRALMEGADEEVRAVLTPEQIEAYDGLLARQPRIRAVRRTLGEDGTTVDTIR